MDIKKAIALGSLLALTAAAGTVFAADQKTTPGQAPAATAAPADQGSTPEKSTSTAKKHKKKHSGSTTQPQPQK